MPTPTPNSANVTVAYGYGYTAPINEPMPANSVAFGGSWGGNWTYTGATDQGYALGITKNANDIRIEEQSTPAQIVTDTTDVSVTFAMAEATLENLKIALGSGSLAVNSGATPPNKVLTLADPLNQVAFGLEAPNIFGVTKPRRLYIPIAVIIAQIAIPLRRAAEKQMYAVTVRAVCPMSSITITDVTG